MSVFQEFERRVVRSLAASHMPRDAIDSVLRSAVLVSCDHTVGGYFLTVRHSLLADARSVWHTPLLVGRADNVQCGFVVLIENGELTLECHSWGNAGIPENFRDRHVAIIEEG
jgi:hypothetical protein